MKRSSRWTETDVRRAIRAAISAGLRPGEFEIRADSDSVRVITFASTKPAPSSEEANPWHSVDLDG